nr:MAG: ORF1 [TTV-like mini virus]
MPYYWRRGRYRRRFWPWRARRAVQRRRWRARRRPIYYGVRKYNFKRKLKTLKLKVWQPKVIRRCSIIGNIVLFQGSPERANNNYIQTIYSYVPPDEPGGGGWTLITESLSSLWEDWEHLKNIWTSSNAALPLVRYLGVDLIFWQSPYTDYIVEVSNCLPMKDTKLKHADSAPNRMLLKRNVIKVPSLETRRKKKPYKRVHVPPPPQMQNKWYFQKDICEIPLVMLTAVAVDFRYPFCASNCKSNNLTLRCLNISFFQYHNFDKYADTTGYVPKSGTYMYSHSGRPDDKPTKNTLIYLGNTKDNTPGKAPTSSKDYTKPENWGNPFWHQYIYGELPVYTSQYSPTALKALGTSEESTIQAMSPMADVYFETFRYNPERDKGTSNRIYLVENFQNTGWGPPTNVNLILEGYPLFDICWGYTDWIEKLHQIQDINQHYLFVIQTDTFNEPRQAFVPLDTSFLTGHGPYDTQINNYDSHHWQPKLRFQTKSINDLCLTGPGCSRPPYGNYMQAKMTYKFRLKWGGCPKTLEQPYDPCSQPNWTIPSNITEAIQIQNPNTDPETELQEWDWRRDYITPKAIARIKKHKKTDDYVQLSTGSKHNPPILHQTLQETTDSSSETEEDQTPIQTQILKLKRKQHLLKQRIRQQLKTQALL